MKVAQVIPTAAPDAQLSSFSDQLAIAEQRLITVLKDFGPEHTEVMKAIVLAESARARITNRVAGIMLGLEARVASLKQGLDKLQAEVAQVTSKDIARSEQSRPYFEAKRNVEELQNFRKVINMKIASEAIDTTLPKMNLVAIVDRAYPAVRPSSPNSTHAFALVAVGILLDLAGFFLLRLGARTTI